MNKALQPKRSHGLLFYSVNIDCSFNLFSHLQSNSMHVYSVETLISVGPTPLNIIELQYRRVKKIRQCVLSKHTIQTIPHYAYISRESGVRRSFWVYWILPTKWPLAGYAITHLTDAPDQSDHVALLYFMYVYWDTHSRPGYEKPDCNFFQFSGKPWGFLGESGGVGEPFHHVWLCTCGSSWLMF